MTSEERALWRALKRVGGWLVVTNALPLDTDTLDGWANQELRRSDIEVLCRALSSMALVDPVTGENLPTHWRCNLHGAKGRTDDISLAQHQNAEHRDATITVTMGFQDESHPSWRSPSQAGESRLFRKRPVVVEAVQVTYDNREEVAAWCGGHAEPAAPSGMIYANGFVQINTLEGRMYADNGDWIIKGVKGEFYPCKPDIFEATYEPVNRRKP